MRGIARLLVASLGLALGCQDDPDLPPPPIGGGTTPVVPPVGGNGPEGGETGSDTRGSGTLDSGTSGTGGVLDLGGMDGTASTTAGSTVLVTGELIAGPTEIVPPLCYVRLSVPESLDPMTHVPLEFVHEEPLLVQALPQPYTLVSLPGDVIGPGESVYVSTLCDVDGDSIPDTVGGYYPGIPPVAVVLPANGIDISLSDL